MVYLILGTGFEETEAIVPCDLLRRAGVEVRLAGIGGLEIAGSHGITVRADCIAEETDFSAAEMLILPGGLRGVRSIAACEPVMKAVKVAYDEKRYVAAICAAPTLLATLGIADGIKMTCYPGMEEKMGAASMTDCAAAVDGTVITGRAAGASFEFGLKLVKVLCGAECAERIAAEVVYR